MFSNDTFSLHNRKDRSENVCERVCAGPSPLLLPVRTLHNIFSQYVFLPFSLSLSLFILSCYVWKLARPVRGVQVQTNRPGRLNIAGSDSREHCAPPSLAVVLGTAASLQTTLVNLNCYLHARTHTHRRSSLSAKTVAHTYHSHKRKDKRDAD